MAPVGVARRDALSEPGLSRAGQARVLHAAVMGSALTATLLLAGLRTIGAIPLDTTPSIPVGVMRVVAFVLFAGATVMLRVLRAALPPAQGDRNAWSEQGQDAKRERDIGCGGYGPSTQRDGVVGVEDNIV